MSLLDRTRIVMVHPFFPENIGAAARAMKNCGLHQLTLVGGCPPDHPNALKMAVHSEEILAGATLVPTLEEALEGVSLSFATTSHGYENARPLLPREAATLAASAGEGQKGQIALVFGNEKNGLKKRELALCHQTLRIPSAVEGSSLNLAQSLMVFAYEWMMAEATPGMPLHSLAPEEDLARIGGKLDELLVKAGFFKPHQALRDRSILARMLTRLRVDADEAQILKSLLRKLGWILEQTL